MSNELIEKCMELAQQIANEINGDLYYVPPEDLDRVLSQLTQDNVEEIANELAQLAYWFN